MPSRCALWSCEARPLPSGASLPPGSERTSLTPEAVHAGRHHHSSLEMKIRFHSYAQREDSLPRNEKVLSTSPTLEKAPRSKACEGSGGSWPLSCCSGHS